MLSHMRGARYSAGVRARPELGGDGVVVVVLERGGDGGGDGAVVEVAPSFGSNLFRFRHGDHELVRCDAPSLGARRWTGTPVLWPIPNRVRGKWYRFGRHDVSLLDVVRPEGNWPLIHGLVDDLAWQHDEPRADGGSASVRTWVEIGPGSDRFRFYPFPSRLTLHVVLGEDGVRVSYHVDNLGDEALPFAFALHPYFALLDGTRSEVVVPADVVMEADGDLLPTGRLLPVTGEAYDLRMPTPAATLELDHVFTRLHAGEPCRLRHPDAGIELVLNASDDFTHVVLYTMKAASDGFVCLENQTGSTDAINLHTRAVESGDAALAEAAHLLVVPPGGSHDGHVDYRVRYL
jgi:aldose 1-epimerase